MWLSPWLLARVIQGSLKKERTQEEIAASLLCSVASENIFWIFCVVFMMVQLEFLWGANVNHYGNLGEILQPLDIFLGSVGCGTDRCIHSPPPPSILVQVLGSVFCKCFPLEFTKEVDRKMVPQIFLTWMKPHK